VGAEAVAQKVQLVMKVQVLVVLQIKKFVEVVVVKKESVVMVYAA